MFPIRDINPTRITPIVTIGLIAINVFVFFFWQPHGSLEEEARFLYREAAVACELTTGEPLSIEEINRGICTEVDVTPPAFPDKNVWLAAFVSMFLHGSLFHLLGNMWFLWIFGNNVEEAYGHLGYLLMYLVAGLVATAAFVALNPATTIPLVGASGAIAGVLGAYLVLFPAHQVLTLVFWYFVPIPAVVYLGLWFLSQFQVVEGVAWEAHVFGFLFGILVTLPIRGALLRRIAALHRPRGFPIYP